MIVPKRIAAILSKRYNYRGCFMSENGQLTAQAQFVMRDLANYCDAYRTTMKTGPNGVDPYASGVAEGRRQVWLRMQSMLRLPDDEVLRAMEQNTHD